MHEMSLVQGVMEIIEDAARTQGFSRVRVVVLEIGRLAAVEVEALRFCFEAATASGVAAGADLRIVYTPGRGCCTECGLTVTVDDALAPCPGCASYRVRVTGGTEMRVRELVVG